jgi:hypothetical protein
VNDIQNVINIGHPILFADDTNIIYTHNNLAVLAHIANLELDQISQWFISNKLSINTSKTKFMVFHRQQMQYNPADIKITLNGVHIENVSNLKFLGVYIQENLSWKIHANYISKKIAKGLGVLHRLKHQLPESILLQLYNSLILSHISYSISVWGNLNQSDKNRILILQKKALRSISNSRYNCHTNPLFIKYNLLKFEDIYKSSCGKLYYCHKKDMLPNFHTLTFDNQPQQSGITRQRSDIPCPLIQYKVTKQCLVPKVAEAWNTLPLQLKTYDKSLISFKKKVKSHYISTYNIPCNVTDCHSCLNSHQ